MVGGTILAYVLAAGASPSVVRAAVMAGVVLLARESGRAGRAPAALALAAFAMLVAEPAMIGDAGFRLSVAATAGLLAWGTPLGRWIGGLAGGRMPGWLAEGLGISLAAQAATLPDVLVTFGRLSLVAPAVNLAVVPLVPAAMGAGVLAMAGGALAMARPPGRRGDDPRAAGLAAAARDRGGRADRGRSAVRRRRDPARGRPGGGARGRRRSCWRPPRSCAGSARDGHGDRAARRRLGAAAARNAARRAGARRSPRRAAARALAVVAAIVVALSTLALADTAGRATRLVMLDVGQGDAILVESRSGGRMLVDGGPDPERLLLELDARVPPWDRRIDLVVLTHPARGPRRRPRPRPGAVPGGPGLRARDARPEPGLGGLGRGAGAPRSSARDARGGCPAAPGRGDR